MARAHGKILLVDDSATVSCVLRTYLMGHDWDFMQESDGDRGLRRALRERPNVIVSDIEMPGRTGLELCQTVKAAPGLRHTRVILISSKWTEERTRHAERVGVDAWLAKPVQGDQLVALVDTLMQDSIRPRG